MAPSGLWHYIFDARLGACKRNPMGVIVELVGIVGLLCSTVVVEGINVYLLNIRKDAPKKSTQR